MVNTRRKHVNNNAHAWPILDTDQRKPMQNPRSLRRLATDHGTLHNTPLPPNYLFDPKVDPTSDLTQLDILLAGPQSTPYETGVFKLHLAIPPTYPTDPPKAFFRTKIFHPNIEPETGAVCVETLKRDWKTTLTLRDVLVTISCLLVYPNASSALNAEAGMLLEQQGGAGWEGFERRAKLMTRLQAGVPRELKDLVRGAQKRGEESQVDGEKIDVERKDSGLEDEGGAKVDKLRRRRRDFALGGRAKSNLQDTVLGERRTRTPSPEMSMSPARLPPPRPFVVQSNMDDVFGNIRLPHPSLQAPQLHPNEDEDSEIQDANQENDTAMSPVAKKPTLNLNPMRHGRPIPLGELTIADDRDTSFDDSMEAEYPPSPRKSPIKQRKTSDEYYHEPGPPSPKKESPRKRAPEYPASPKKTNNNPGPRRGLFHQDSAMGHNMFAPSRPDFLRAESSRTAAVRGGSRLFFTPDNQLQSTLLSSQTPDAGETDESEFEMSFEILRRSERKKKHLLSSPPKRKVRTRNATPERDPFSGAQRFGAISAIANAAPAAAVTGVRKSPKPVKNDKSVEQTQKEKTEAKLWKLCGGDVERWNKGDFGGFLNIKSSRW